MILVYELGEAKIANMKLHTTLNLNYFRMKQLLIIVRRFFRLMGFDI